MQTEYTIDGNDNRGYFITHRTSGRIWNTCPCCAKRLTTRQAAEALVVNLTVSGFANLPPAPESES